MTSLDNICSLTGAGILRTATAGGGRLGVGRRREARDGGTAVELHALREDVPALDCPIM
jgi:hypothetical protein